MTNDVFLGIDLGGTEIKAVALERGGSVLVRRRIATEAAEGRAAVVARLGELIRAMAQDGAASGAIARSTVRAVGMAVPGVIDMTTGVCELLPAFTPEWTGFELKRALEQATGLPVAILNDVRAAAVGEHMLGAGRNYQDFICIAVGTGIGGGLVLGNRLYLGSRGAAGEVGHQTVVADGPRCGCGNRGCLEAVASGTAIARAAQQAIADGDEALLRLVGTETPSPYQIAAAAEAGNPTAQRIYEQAGTWIGLGLSNVICALNPQAVVVGGGVSRAGELLLAPIRREIEQRTMVFSQARGGVEVVQSPLGGEAGALGSAAWAMRTLDEQA